MAGSQNARVDRVWQALAVAGYAVEESLDGTFSVRVTGQGEPAVGVWIEEDWVRLRCIVTQGASVSKGGLAALVRANRHLKRVRAALDDQGAVVLRADYPLFLWFEDDFRAVVATMFAEVERVCRVTLGGDS